MSTFKSKFQPLSSILVQTQNNMFLLNWSSNFFLFLPFFSLYPQKTKINHISTSIWSAQHHSTALTHWSKYTISVDVRIKYIFFISGNCLDTVIDGSFMGIVLVSTIKQEHRKGGGAIPSAKS